MIHTRYYTRCVICAAGMRRGLWAVGYGPWALKVRCAAFFYRSRRSLAALRRHKTKIIATGDT